MLDPLFFPYYGGTEKVVLEVGSRLVKDHGYQVDVLTSMIPQANGIQREEIRGINVIRSPSIFFDRMPFFLPPPFTLAPSINRDLARECGNNDIFHVHNRFWYSPLTYHKVKHGIGKKLMVTIHNARPRGISESVDFWGGMYDDTMGNRIFSICDRINCVSNATMMDTIPEPIRDRCSVVYNGVDTSKFKPGLDHSGLKEELGLGEGSVILSNGRLIEQKGFKYLIDAFAIVRKEIKDAELVIIGKGPLKEELILQASERGVQGSVRFVTGIPEPKLPLYYSMADLFVLPSLYEPSAVVLYEALSSGKPIVATSVGGNQEIVSKECGETVPSRDTKALVRSISGLLADPTKRMLMGRASRERAVERFDWDVITKEWDRSYKHLL
jgi:glycosyltransferase involved in cell wall biosynthesis